MKKIRSCSVFIFLALVVLLCAACDNPLFINLTNLYEVTFSTNGGTSIDSYRTDEIKETPFTSRAGFTFMGWHNQSDFSDDAIVFPLKIQMACYLRGDLCDKRRKRNRFFSRGRNY